LIDLVNFVGSILTEKGHNRDLRLYSKILFNLQIPLALLTIKHLNLTRKYLINDYSNNVTNIARACLAPGYFDNTVLLSNI